jgi:hypothetical protein
MAQSRYYVERMVAANAKRFGAPVHITPTDGMKAGGPDAIHGTVEKVGIKYLHLTDHFPIPWSMVGWIEWYTHEVTIPRGGK